MVVIYLYTTVYPNGCSLSAPLAANFVPTIVNTEDNTSVKLFTASRDNGDGIRRKAHNHFKITRNDITYSAFYTGKRNPRLRAAIIL